MTRKAAAKRSEANAAVLSRSAGLDQRFKMSASVAGLPSIYAATASLSFFLFARVGAHCGRALSAATATNHTVLKGLSSSLTVRIYAVQVSCSAAVDGLGCCTELKRFT